MLKKTYSLLVITLLLVSSVMAIEEVKMEKISFWERFQEKIFPSDQALFITGGGFSSDNIQYGTKVDATIEVRYKQNSVGSNPDGKKQYFVIGVSDGTNTISMGERFSTLEAKVGNWNRMTITGLDTSKIPQTWCNRFVQVVGLHYVWVNNQWVLDKSQTGTFESTLSSGTRLVCPDTPSQCEAKTLGNVCHQGSVARKSQNGVVLPNGQCAVKHIILDQCTPQTEQCQESTGGAQCVSTGTQIPEGTIECYGDRGAYKKFTGGHWTFGGCNEGLLCQEGRCTEDQTFTSCTENVNEVCSDGSTITSKECQEGVLVETGAICGTGGTFYFPNEELTDCSVVDYQTDYSTYESCVTDLSQFQFSNDDQPSALGSTIGNTGGSLLDNLLGDQYKWYTYSVFALILIFILVMIYGGKKRGKK